MKPGTRPFTKVARMTTVGRCLVLQIMGYGRIERLDSERLWSLVTRRRGGCAQCQIGQKWTFEVNVLVCARTVE